MKNPALSLWMSTANRAAGWWMGHATNAVRRQQRAALAEMTRAATGAKPKRKPRPGPKRRTR
ncbi:hypothetical protein Q8W71_13065 [Methylobacterium sp. NEAU 140]|uniref:hypothetical protein n=1 Tax=Methylobacterium sp. NEAU 140 TaxID=3064945 RepID=UPI002735EB18|nr:hypothetical protein [Methylobacterium sp. NEAU 140]MDP4023562.1 hypothetical protein [Methylobacterium sp. NEAU 140]